MEWTVAEDSIFERIDAAIAGLKRDGWVPRRIELTKADLEGVRVQILDDIGVWVKPDGISAYRDTPITQARKAQVLAERDGDTKAAPVPGAHTPGA
jgi:hypothetical protein